MSRRSQKAEPPRYEQIAADLTRDDAAAMVRRTYYEAGRSAYSQRQDDGSYSVFAKKEPTT